MSILQIEMDSVCFIEFQIKFWCLWFITSNKCSINIYTSWIFLLVHIFENMLEYAVHFIAEKLHENVKVAEYNSKL